MDERETAQRNLERIRSLMERAGEYSNLSGFSAILAGATAIVGALVCRQLRINFNHVEGAEALAVVWGSVFAISVAQSIVFAIAGARRRSEPAWGHLSRQVLLAVAPAIFVGGTITFFGLSMGQLDLLPPIWMLGYGSSLMGLGLYAGRSIQATGVLFLLAGAVALFWFREYGLRTMLVSFGGFHIVLGSVMVWKSRN